MNRVHRRSIVGSRLGAIVVTVLLGAQALGLGSPARAAVPLEPSASNSAVGGRIADTADPVSAAIQLSQAAFPNGSAQHVVIGAASDTALTLSGTALAGSAGPILYAGHSKPNIRLKQDRDRRHQLLDPNTLAEVRRVLGSPQGCAQGPEIYLLGGPSSVSRVAQRKLEVDGYCVRRLEGRTVAEASVRIAEAVGERPLAFDRVLISNLRPEAQIVSVGAYAAAVGTPILLTDGQRLEPAVVRYLAERRPTDVFLMGGPAVLSDGILDEAARHVRDDDMQVPEIHQAGGVPLRGARRIGNGTSDAVAIDVAEQLWTSLRPRGLTVVNPGGTTGAAFALAAAPLSAALGAPQVYSGNKTPTAATASFLERYSYDHVRIVGSTSMISDDAHQGFAERLGQEPSLVGPDVIDYTSDHFLPREPLLDSYRLLQRGQRILTPGQESCYFPTQMTATPADLPNFHLVLRPVAFDRGTCSRLIEIGALPPPALVAQPPSDVMHQESGGKEMRPAAPEKLEVSTDNNRLSSAEVARPHPAIFWSYSHVDEAARIAGDAIQFLPFPFNLIRHLDPTTEAVAKIWSYFDGCATGPQALARSDWRLLQIPGLTHWVMRDFVGASGFACDRVWAKNHFHAENTFFSLPCLSQNNPNVHAHHWPTFVEAQNLGFARWDMNTTVSNGRCNEYLAVVEEMHAGPQTRGPGTRDV